MSFASDLKFGHYYEDVAQNYFIEKLEYSDRLKKDKWDFKDKDGTMHEVKSDRLSYKTGNICIEFMNGNQPTGISNTWASVYIYFIIKPDRTHDCYKIPIDDLKKIIINKKVVRCGDRKQTSCYLISIKDIDQYLILPI